MVCAFKGWNDAGDAASSAVSFLASALERAALCADRLGGVLRLPGQPSEHPLQRGGSSQDGARLARAARGRSSGRRSRSSKRRAPRAPRDLVLVQGVEPSMRWRAFSSHIVDLAEALGVQLVVTLGALLGDVPHTRPVAMTGHRLRRGAARAPRPAAGPATRARPGIVGVLHTACAQAGLPSASLWAAVPHYVAAAANPKAALALLRRVEVLVGVSVDVSELESIGGATTSARWGWRCAATPTSRRSWSGWSRRPTARSRPRPRTCLLATSWRREFQRFLRQRGRETK